MLMFWAAVGLIILIYLMVKITANRLNSNEQEFLSHGNISIFMDKRGSIDVIPFKLDKFRVGKASGYPLTLVPPYSNDKVGAIVRKALMISESDKCLSSRELMGSLGYYDWREYSKDKKSVSLACKNQEVVLKATIRKNDGSYSFLGRRGEKILSASISDTELGKAVLEMMKLSL